MRISEIAARCPGFALGFKPRYGSGWRACAGERPISYEEIDKLGTFMLTASEAFQWEGAFRGFVGEITEKDHLLDGHRFVLWSMSGLDSDVSDSTDGRWDLYFAHQEFRTDRLDFPEPEKAGVGYGVPVLRRGEPIKPLEATLGPAAAIRQVTPRSGAQRGAPQR